MLTRHALFRMLSVASCVLITAVGIVHSSAAQAPPRVEFTRLVAHWDAYGSDEYLPFVTEARPDIAQVGFYGAHFWSLAHTSSYGGYPAHLPVQGLRECAAWFTRLNQALHERQVKVVGHFNVKFLVGDPESNEGPRGFFKFYRELWDEGELGAKPVADPLDLLEKNLDGTPIIDHGYGIGGMAEYWGCLNNPHWREVLKAWTRRAIECGVDGLMINYFYRHNCLCDHCRAAWHEHLQGHFTPQELRDRFQIADLESHVFNEIVSWHDPKESTPLRREMLRFSQIANKRAFDEVFVEYGRSLKPDLILAQWDHLGDFQQVAGDERCLLPAEMWGKNEDYLWYSTGGAAYYTDLANGFLGEATLQARYIRGAFDDKPFTLGKYENTRIRLAIAELAANGGAPMGFYTRFTDPLARAEIVRYYGFLRRYDDLYRASRSQHEVVLLYPRSQVHAGDMAALDEFKRLGKVLLDQHVLFDVLPDDLLTDEARARYRQVIVPDATTATNPTMVANLSQFTAPATVRVSLSRPAVGDEWTLHLVNYNRDEPAEAKSAGSGIVDEKPRPVQGVRASLALPNGGQPAHVWGMTPESPDPVAIEWRMENSRLVFDVPEFLVYQAVRIEFLKSP